MGSVPPPDVADLPTVAFAKAGLPTAPRTALPTAPRTAPRTALPTALPPPVAEPRSPVLPGAQVVAFVGAKGGCGTTLLAANLAAGLVTPGTAATRRVCLVDADFFKGDVAGALNLWPTRTMHDLMIDPSRLDEDVTRGTAVAHASGLWVLAQPHDLSRTLQVNAAEVTRLVATLRTTFDLCFADAGSRMDEVASATAMLADLVVVVATPEVGVLRDAGRVIDLLRGLGRGPDQLRLVINKWPRQGFMAVEEVASLLDIPVLATIARDDAACSAADREGRLLAEVAPRSEVAQDIAGARARLMGLPPPPDARSRWSLKRLFLR